MSDLKDALRPMLKLALTTSANHFQFYHNAAMKIEYPRIKALLLVLSETEEGLMARIEDMIATGVVDEVEEIMNVDDFDTPDATPFDLSRDDTDPRIYICNRALEQEIRGYTFYLTIAARAKSEVISHVFEYFAYVKTLQIEKIRRVCQTF
jgi:rubrerythrin